MGDDLRSLREFLTRKIESWKSVEKDILNLESFSTEREKEETFRCIRNRNSLERNEFDFVTENFRPI